MTSCVSQNFTFHPSGLICDVNFEMRKHPYDVFYEQPLSKQTLTVIGQKTKKKHSAELEKSLNQKFDHDKR